MWKRYPNVTGLAASSDNPTGLGGDYDLEESEGHARVWLDRPFDVSTIIEEVGNLVPNIGGLLSSHCMLDRALECNDRSLACY